MLRIKQKSIFVPCCEPFWHWKPASWLHLVFQKAYLKKISQNLTEDLFASTLPSLDWSKNVHRETDEKQQDVNMLTSVAYMINLAYN